MPEIRPTLLFVRSRHEDPENNAACRWVSATREFRLLEATAAELARSPSLWDETKAVWWHALDLANDVDFAAVGKQLHRFLSNGGGALLSLAVCRRLGDLGLESSPPQVLGEGVWPDARDENVFYGLIGYRGHPIFDAFNGGVYLWQPQPGDRYCEIGYGPTSFPRTGKVVAVRRVHIGIEPDWKLAWEYDIGQGRLLAIGAYLLFSPWPHRFRAHLERFTAGCLRYLSSPGDSEERRTYWNPKTRGIAASPTNVGAVLPLAASSPPADLSGRELQSPAGENAPFDLAGRRLLLLGTERGAIQEIWIHPFRAWQNLRLSLQDEEGKLLSWSEEVIREVIVRPEVVVRAGRVGTVGIRETVTVSPTRPVAAIWIEADGPVRLLLSAETDFRLMWPYDPGRLGRLYYGCPDSLNGVLVHDASQEFVTFLGCSLNPDDLQVVDTSDDQASRLSIAAEFQLDLGSPLVMLASGGNEGIESAVETWNGVAADPSQVHAEALRQTTEPDSNGFQFECADRLFSEAVGWALTKTRSFFAETPGIGSGWMAGYAPTRPGWNSGRPGYAWYFGRDSVWTAFAMLEVGDFESVRSVLELLGRYQEFTGKIFHELTTSGVVHYDAADSTPLYLILMARYLDWSGDLKFVRSEWDRVEKALAFCFRTDRDGDGLIENAGVGHGWVEGGRLAGVHVSFELAGIWAAALEACEAMARAVGRNRVAVDVQKARERVHRVLNTHFWNSADRFFFYAKMPDGTSGRARTVLASVPLLLGTVSPEKAEATLAELARPAYATDWGVRMIGEDSPDYNPAGYHQGSVWPLFTGWLSLAEYRHGRPTQAFAHLYGTVWNFLDGAKGCIAEVLHGEVYRPAGVCPHQAWSETMLLEPLLEGLLGLRADALRRRIRLAPQWPPHWHRARVCNLRLGESRFSMAFERMGPEWRYQFESQGPPFRLEFVPLLPAAAELAGVDLDGEPVGLTAEMSVVFELDGRRELRLRVPRFLGAVPPTFRPRQGDRSRGFRILQEGYDGRRLEIECEGLPGVEASLYLATQGFRPERCCGGQLLGSGSRWRIAFAFPNTGRYARHSISVELSPC